MEFAAVAALVVAGLWSLAKGRRSKYWKKIRDCFELADYPIDRAQPDKEAGGWFKSSGGKRFIKTWVTVNRDGIAVRPFGFLSRLDSFRIGWERIAKVEFLAEYRHKEWGMDYFGRAKVTFSDDGDTVLEIPWREMFSEQLPASLGYKSETAPYVRDA
ncbi:MAG: hypothetical protein GXP14_14400 [Gammaproteobacteria bacterium]|nr:hypothetical protein [Gammaproteobacteria bacterium]